MTKEQEAAAAKLYKAEQKHIGDDASAVHEALFALRATFNGDDVTAAKEYAMYADAQAKRPAKQEA